MCSKCPHRQLKPNLLKLSFANLQTCLSLLLVAFIPLRLQTDNLGAFPDSSLSYHIQSPGNGLFFSSSMHISPQILFITLLNYWVLRISQDFPCCKEVSYMYPYYLRGLLWGRDWRDVENQPSHLPSPILGGFRLGGPGGLLESHRIAPSFRPQQLL